MLFLTFTALVAFGFLATLPRLIPVPYQYDFTAYYVAGRVLNNNDPLYQAEPMIQAAKYSDVPVFTPYLYPPVVAALFRPLAALPFDFASSLWYIFNLICLVASVYTLLRIMHYNRTLTIPVSFAALTLSPVFLTLLNGQITALLLLLLVLAYYLSSSPNSDFKKDVIAGMLVGIATALKLYPGLIGVFYLIHRKIASLIAMIITIIIMFMIGIIAGEGLPNTIYWLSQILPNTSQLLPHPFLSPSNQSVFAVVERLFSLNQVSYSLDNDSSIVTTIYPLYNSPQLGNFLAYLLAGVILLLSLAWPVIRLRRCKSSVPLLADFALLLIAIVLVTPVVWGHYYILLLPAVFILIKHSRNLRLLRLVLLLAGILIELERYWRWIVQPLPVNSAIFASLGFSGTLLLWIALLWITFPSEHQSLATPTQSENVSSELMPVINHK